MKKLVLGMMVVCSLMALSGTAWCKDNGNGTVTVNGQVWLKDAGCLGMMNWDAAMSRAKSLAHGQCGLTDNSKAGDWRLPIISELRNFSFPKSHFANVKTFYWSSTTGAGDTSSAWSYYLLNGNVDYNNKALNGYVWPVREGHYH